MVPRASQCHTQYIIKGLAPQWRWDTKLTHSYFPYPAAPLFQLSQVPSAINYILCSVMQSLPQTTQMWTKPKPIGFAIGINVVSSCNQYALEVISLWTDLAIDKDNLSWLPSHKPSEKPNFSLGPKKRLVAELFRDTIGYLSQTSNSVLRDNLIRDQDG